MRETIFILDLKNESYKARQMKKDTPSFANQFRVSIELLYFKFYAKTEAACLNLKCLIWLLALSV